MASHDFTSPGRDPGVLSAATNDARDKPGHDDWRGMREGTRKGDQIPLDFFPRIGYVPATPPNRGPAHDGELGRGGGQACGWRLTCAPLPGAEGETRGHYDLRAYGQVDASQGLAAQALLQRPHPAGCGRCSALYRQLPSWHTAPGSARASHFSREGQTQPSPRMPHGRRRSRPPKENARLAPGVLVFRLVPRLRPGPSPPARRHSRGRRPPPCRSPCRRPRSGHCAGARRPTAPSSSPCWRWPARRGA